jgi:flagellar FliL protein
MSAPTTARPQPVGTAAGAGTDGAAEGKGGRRKRPVLLAAVLAVLLAAGGWWFFLRGDGDGTPPPPEPGAVMTLDPISVNLAGGHYLKVGMALQLVKKPSGEFEGSRALDIAIELFSGKDMADLAAGEPRQAVKKELVTRISKAYDGDVIDVYFTEFVMQ